jgi:hypothetical protein
MPLTISAFAFVAMFAASAILEIGLIKLSYAQVTAEQNPMCDPSDTHINGIESRECGVPKTPSLSSSSSSGVICDPSDTHINGIESRECGVPKTPSSSSLSSAVANSTTTTSAAVTTTTAQPSENMTSLQGPIPGLLP